MAVGVRVTGVLGDVTILLLFVSGGSNAPDLAKPTL
jgi:hypothetical protein